MVKWFIFKEDEIISALKLLNHIIVAYRSIAQGIIKAIILNAALKQQSLRDNIHMKTLC